MTRPRTVARNERGQETRKVRIPELREYPDVPPDQVCPVSMTLDCTHVCPFNCRCCIEAKGMRHSGHASLAAATCRSLIDRFVDQGGHEVLLYGGEPTAHLWFGEIARHAAIRVPNVRVVSNGYYLSEPRVHQALWDAAQYTDVTVRVSLNAGTPETHGLLHGCDGAWDRVVDGMTQLTRHDTPLDLGISFLVEEANAREVCRGYDIACQAGAGSYWVRAKTGMHSVGMDPLSPNARAAVLDALSEIEERAQDEGGPSVHVAPWYLAFLRYDVQPDTNKPYSSCYYCGSARIVVTPPDPGLAWSCTYWRGSPRHFIANLRDTPFGTEEFEQKRIAAIRRVNPSTHCANVICNRNSANKAIWQGVIEKPMPGPKAA